MDKRGEAWLQSLNDPLRFVTEVLQATPEPHQVEALNAIAKYDRVAIRSSHDQGKTALLAWVCWWWLTTHKPCKIPVAANTQDQLRDVTWTEITKWGRRLPEWLSQHYDFGQERIWLKSQPEEIFAVARTASKTNPEALQGFHSEHLLFLLEEASGMEDVVFEVAAGALSSKGAKALMIANPTRSQGYFARAFGVNRPLWHCMHWPWRKCPWNDERYPANMAAEYGEHSNVYKVRVLGDFPTSEDNAVIPLSMIEEAIVRDVDLIEHRTPVWGVDVARFGGDRSALIKRWGNHILEPAKTWRGRDLMESTGIVAREFFETPEWKRPKVVNTDVIGIGAGVVDRLREIGIPAYGINVGERAEDETRFARRRDELWWKIREWLQGRDVKMVDDPALIADLTAPTYRILSSGKLQVESKEDMKARGINSPDLADALALTFGGGEYVGQLNLRPYALDDNYDPLDIDRNWRTRDYHALD